MQNNKAPSGEKILKTLIELYADQMGVKVKYSIKDKDADKDALAIASKFTNT